MKYILLILLFSGCLKSLREQDFDDGCLEEAKFLSRNTHELANLVFTDQKVKAKIIIDIEMGAWSIEKCIKHYAGK